MSTGSEKKNGVAVRTETQLPYFSLPQFATTTSAKTATEMIFLHLYLFQAMSLTKQKINSIT